MMHFPLVKKFQGGMCNSLPGVLHRAADRCERSRADRHLAFPLRELRRDIDTVRAAQSDGEALELLSQFLNKWVSD